MEFRNCPGKEKKVAKARGEAEPQEDSNNEFLIETSTRGYKALQKRECILSIVINEANN